MFISGRIGHSMTELSITDGNAPPCIQYIYIYIHSPECIEMFGIQVVKMQSGFNSCARSHFFSSSSSTWYVNKWLWCCSSVGK